MKYPILSFNAGEISPLVDARSDIDKYKFGCRILENMIPRMYGPAERRPGTKYIDTCTGPSKVIPFIYSNTISYIILLDTGFAYFYYNGGKVLDSNGDRLSVAIPYDTEDVFELQYKQLNDVMWIVHGDYQPRKLSRTSATAFDLSTITFNKGPFKTRNDIANDDGVTMTPSVTTGSGTLTASSATFDSQHVGALFSVTQPRVNTTVSGSATATGVIGSSIFVEGAFSFNTHGTWSGTVVLERSIDNSTWETFRTWVSADDRNVQYTGSEIEEDIYYRINVTAYTSGTINADLTVNSSTQTGICRITSFTSSTVVAITVLKDFASTNADVRWAEGCWSAYRGYPKTVTFFEQRAIYGGTDHQPQTVWLSATDDYENFKEGTNDDQAFSLTLASDTRCAIQWLSASEALLVGTSSGEYRIRANTFDEPVTPTNFSFKLQTSHGSKYRQAITVNEETMFIDFVGRKIRSAVYDGNKDKYVARDITALAEHITDGGSFAGGIVDWSYQRNPDSIIWAVRADGVLLSCSYEPEQKVIGWARHPFAVPDKVDQYRYPVLQDLTAAEIPDAPTAPSLTAGTTPVTNATELQAMSGSGKYILSNDIDLDAVVWTPITGFSGVLDGAGYTISNLTVSAPASQEQGLFGDLQDGAEIYDLTLDNFSISGDFNVGALAGLVFGTVPEAGAITISNVTVTNSTLTAATGNVGALLGEAAPCHPALIFNCSVVGCSIIATATARVGGFIGNIETQATPTLKSAIVNCSVDSTTTIQAGPGTSVGGFIGEGNSTLASEPYIIIQNCYSEATITITGILGKAGGFIGQPESDDTSGFQFIDCYATGDINAPTPVAGTIDFVGGFVGFSKNYHEYINCYATGNITLSIEDGAYIGGFVGSIEDLGHWLHCWSTGDVTIVGSVNEDSLIGGWGGYGFTSASSGQESILIERCWSTGDVTSETAFSFVGGGFFGGMDTHSNNSSNTIIIKNCYGWGSVSSNAVSLGLPIPTSGGFMGWSENSSSDIDAISLDNCYCAQTNSAAGSGLTNQLPLGVYSHGFGAKDQGIAIQVTDSFWDNETSEVTQSTYGEGHITTWMQTKSNYVAAGWNFDTIWYIPPGGQGINSVAVIPSATEDEIWLVATFEINSAAVTFLLQMQPRNVLDQEDQWFVDAGLDYDSTATSSFSGLDHLEGESLVVLGDGARFANATVSSGAITLVENASRVIVGLPFRYKLKPMRFDLQVDGGTKGTLKRFAELVISFYKTLNAEYGVDTDNLFNIDFRTTEAYGSPPALFTGDVVVTTEGGHNVEDPIIITDNGPFPCVIRALIPRIEVTGR